jgi:hypothetical protein
MPARARLGGPTLALQDVVQRLALLSILLFACGDPPNQTCTDCSVETCGYRDGLSDSEQLLLFRGSDVEVMIVRDYVDNGIGHSAIYELRGFALSMDGKVDCFNQGLEYENSHHNWVDRARAQTIGGKVELEIEFQPEDPNDFTSEWKWRFALNGPGFDPIALEVVEGNPQGK